MTFFKHCWSTIAQYLGDDRNPRTLSHLWLLRGADGVFRHPPANSRAEWLFCPDCRRRVPFSKHHLSVRFETDHERALSDQQATRIDDLRAELLAALKWMNREV